MPLIPQLDTTKTRAGGRAEPHFQGWREYSTAKGVPSTHSPTQIFTHHPPIRHLQNIRRIFCLRHFLSYCASQTTNSSRGVVPLVPTILETTNTRVARRSGTAFPRVEISKTINKREGQHRDDSATNGEGGYESIISIAGAIPRARV